MTKVEMIKVNTMYANDNRRLMTELEDAKRASNNEYIRREFAKAFSWFKRSSYGYDNSEPKLPSWEEIFIKVGSLLDKTNNENRLISIEDRLNHFDSLFTELQEKK